MLTILKNTYLESSRKFHRIILFFLAVSVVLSYLFLDSGTKPATMIFYLVLCVACFVFDLFYQRYSQRKEYYSGIYVYKVFVYLGALIGGAFIGSIPIPLLGMFLIYGILRDIRGRRLAWIVCFLAVVIFGFRRFSIPRLDQTLIVHLDPEKYPLDSDWLVIPRNESISTADLCETDSGTAILMHFYNCETNVITLFDNHRHEYRLDIRCDEDLNVYVKDREPWFHIFGTPIQR